MARMVSYVSNDIKVRYPSTELINWCKWNLVMPNPEYYQMKNLGFRTNGLDKTMALFSYRNDWLVLPFGLLRPVMPFISKGEIVCDFADERVVEYESDIELLDYQEEAVEKLIKKKYGILNSQAASGKTIMALSLIARLGCKALWITHTKDLLKQSYNQAAKHLDKDLLGTITEGKVNIGEGITFATVQTLANLDLSKLKYEWDCIVVDECHRVSGSPKKLRQFSYVLNSLAAKHKYGLSATLHRSDGMTKTIFAYIGPIAHIVPKDATKNRIMQVTIMPKPAPVVLDNKCFKRNGHANPAIVTSRLVDNEERNILIANDLIDSTEHFNLILSTRIEHLKTLYSMLPDELQEESVLVTGSAKNKAEKLMREEAIEEMKNGTKRYLFATYQLAKEGLDIPRLDRLFLTVPQSDYSVIVQSVGRIARTVEGKENPICYDYVDEDEYFKKKFQKRKENYLSYGYDIG